MKKRRTIYVEDSIWAGMKYMSTLEGKSIGDYLSGLHYSNVTYVGKTKIVVDGKVLREGDTIANAIEKIHTQEVSEKEPEEAVVMFGDEVIGEDTENGVVFNEKVKFDPYFKPNPKKGKK